MAKKGIGRDANRVELYKVVPRSVPFAIGITPSDICNFRCNYCNQSTSAGIKDAKVITWDEFMIQIHQVEELLEKGNDDLKIIRFIGNGEPLINKRLPDMIRYCAEKKLAPRLEVTSNGSLLNHNLSDELIDAGMTRILFSVQGVNNEQYRKTCGYNIDLDHFLSELKYLYDNRKECKVYIKTVDTIFERAENQSIFYDMFSDVCDEMSVENIIRACADVDYDSISSINYDERSRYGNAVCRKKCCDTLFMHMNIHSNGDVDCCGCIYPPQYIGNVYKNPLAELWNGERHKSLMKAHLEGRRFDIEPCNHCDSVEHYNGFSEDNLDDHLEEVLARVRCL